MEPNPITEAIEVIGVRELAKQCGLMSYQAVLKWQEKGLPRTEWTGETNYSAVIERLTKKKISRSRLLEWSQARRVAA